jgi:hypothetical protein
MDGCGQGTGSGGLGGVSLPASRPSSSRGTRTLVRTHGAPARVDFNSQWLSQIAAPERCAKPKADPCGAQAHHNYFGVEAAAMNGSTPLLFATQNTGRAGSGSADAKAQQKEILRILTEHGAK